MLMVEEIVLKLLMIASVGMAVVNVRNNKPHRASLLITLATIFLALNVVIILAH